MVQPPDSAERELWRRVFEAADQALELGAAERAELLAQYQATDPAVGKELAAVIGLAAAESALESPASAFAAPFMAAVTDDEANPSAGELTFGSYRVVRELGRGGMGTVYLAERADDQYHKQVALKVLPHWSGPNRRRLHQFIEERQILAGLEHPGIARLLDGGISRDGLPWFALEYVDGQPIDQYCDERRLSLAERLGLFCDVCAAVQYAHRNLVIHRDLKPPNILVTPTGRVALLDFGIARFLDNRAAHALTVTAERVMTPLFASPEQIRGGPVSTASDVYALGVLLHVLLTGGYPYRLANLESYAVAHAVLEQDAERPSVTVTRAGAVPGRAGARGAEAGAAARGHTPAKLARSLRGDLDAIVLKAVDKEPNRRYATAEQLETDVRRHLTGLPVLARPESRLYHTSRFVRRHWLGVGSAAAVAVLVLTFTAAMTVQRSRIRAQAERIAVERDRAEQVAHFLMNLFASADPTAPGAGGATALEILDHTAASIDRPIFSEPEQRARVLLQMAQTYHRLSYHDRALSLADSSLAIRRRLRPARELDVAEALYVRGEALFALQQLVPAEAAYAEALALRRAGLGARDGAVARALVQLATVLRAQRRLGEAERLAREANAIDEARSGDARVDRAESAGVLAAVLLERGDHDAAARLYLRALALMREKHPEEHVDVARAVMGLGTALKAAGDHVAADSLLGYALALHQRLMVASAFMVTGEMPLQTIPRADESAAVTVPSAGSAGAASPALPGRTTAGSLIAFSSDRERPDRTGDGGNVDIYVMIPDGSGQRRLTDNEGPDDNPAWSPDGGSIAFTSMRDGSVGIFLMNADGTEQRRLTDPHESGVGFRRPAWSPDGRRLAFQSVLRPDIYITNSDGSGLTNVSNHPARDQGVDWAPNGRRLAFVSDRDGNNEIYLMDPDGKNVTRLTFEDAVDNRPQYSPDGRRIAFQSTRDGDQEIYVMDADGHNPERLTFYPGEDAHPTWSPDGRRIAFHRRVLGHIQVYVMNADGSGVTRLTAISPVAYSAFPRWSPALR